MMSVLVLVLWKGSGEGKCVEGFVVVDMLRIAEMEK